ncbi:MAG TPA: ABC transporter substrate-binding protein [Rhodopila sp.]|uniref:ABC transporter substrate-binding protein n=1 Tax=Rhodopila sp. TaxID=2480087 RepID=UPI002BC00317|nr:ABC transporter substrate-binding protein [Rhodopila sp.]HVY15195.1 ABC transporter substrate-binding protein [Rhodopila sp.]
MRLPAVPRLFLALAATVLLIYPPAARACSPKVGAADLVEAGKLQLSINPTLPPQQYVDEKGELQGLNVELGRAIGEKLCLKTEFVRMDFPAMVPALKAGRFDGIDTGMFWTEERSKLMYMVPYAQQTIGAFAPADSPLAPKTMEELSGHTAGIEINTYQERKINDLNAQLKAEGKKPIELRTFTTATDATAALRAGQVEVVITIAETVKKLGNEHGMKVLLTGFGGTDITFDFRDKPLAEAVATALTEIRKDGLYDKLFDKFGMSRLSGPTFAIRGPGPS